MAAWRAAYRGLMADYVLDLMRVEDRAKSWRALTQSEDATLNVAERGGAIVGFCALALPSRDADAGPGTLEVAALYVTPEDWRTGVGSALLEQALDAAPGWDEATLWMLAGNDPALCFYRRFGFVPDGTERRHERIGAREVRLRREADEAP